MATVPGLRFFHDGQLEGRRLKIPIQLLREAGEVQDPEIAEFYEKLLSICKSEIFHQGDWKLLEVNPTMSGGKSCQNLLAWSWRYRKKVKVILVNYSDAYADGMLLLSHAGFLNGGHFIFQDELTQQSYGYSTNPVFPNSGFPVNLGPWETRIFDVG